MSTDFSRVPRVYYILLLRIVVPDVCALCLAGRGFRGAGLRGGSGSGARVRRRVHATVRWRVRGSSGDCAAAVTVSQLLLKNHSLVCALCLAVQAFRGGAALRCVLERRRSAAARACDSAVARAGQ